jgi:hypothetical protein
VVRGDYFGRITIWAAAGDQQSESQQQTNPFHS